MKRTILLLWMLMLSLAVLLAAGCAKKPAQTAVTPPVEEAPAAADQREQDTRGIEERAITEAPAQDRLLPKAEATTPGLQRIHFDFDQHTLTPQARDILAGNAAYMKENSRVKVRVEGHTDERGSDEYNLALGERRARAARDYLISLGIQGDRLTTVSYGEEMPIASGRSESAWSQNRRAEFNVIYP